MNYRKKKKLLQLIRQYKKNKYIINESKVWKYGKLLPAHIHSFRKYLYKNQKSLELFVKVTDLLVKNKIIFSINPVNTGIIIGIHGYSGLNLERNIVLNLYNGKEDLLVRVNDKDVKKESITKCGFNQMGKLLRILKTNIIL